MILSLKYFVVDLLSLNYAIKQLLSRYLKMSSNVIKEENILILGNVCVVRGVIL